MHTSQDTPNKLKPDFLMQSLLGDVDTNKTTNMEHLSKSTADLTGSNATAPLVKPRSYTLGAMDMDKYRLQEFSADENWLKYFPRLHSDSICEAVPQSPENTDSACVQKESKGSKQKTPLHKIKLWSSGLESKSSWFMLFVCLCPIFFFSGMDVVSFSIYYVEYAKYFHNTTRSAIALITALKLATEFLFGIVSGVLVTRFGSRRVATCGGMVMSLSMFISTFAPNVMMLYFTQGVFLGVGHSLVSMSTNILIQKTFHKNRVLAAGISMMSLTAGNVAGVQLINFLINCFGWRGALLIQAAITANIVPFNLLSVFLHTETPATHNATPKNEKEMVDKIENEQQRSFKNKSYSEKNNIDSMQIRQTSKIKQFGLTVKNFLKDIFDFSLFKKPVFILIALSGLLDRFNNLMYVSHMPSRAVWLGMTRDDGAFFISMCGFGIIGTRIVVSFMANIDCTNRALLFSVGTLWGGVDSFIIAFWRTYVGQSVASTLNGIHIGMTNTVINVMLVDLMGIELLPRALALYNLAVGVSIFTSPVIGGYIYDVTKNYDIPFIVAGATGILSGVFGITSTALDGRKRQNVPTMNA